MTAPDAPAVVLIFTEPECPISNRYAPEVRRLATRFADRGIVFRLVYPDPDLSTDEIRDHLRQFSFSMDAVRDPRHVLVRRTGVRVTPEVAVFRSGGEMVYRGRIDNRFVDFGKSRARATTHELEWALTAILENRKLEFSSVPAVGCFIAGLQ